MLSVARLIRLRLIHATALVALLVFGWQGSAQVPAIAALHGAASAAGQSVVIAEALQPAQTILPATTVEIARPAAQQQRPSTAAPTALVADDTIAVPPPPFGRPDGDAARQPAASLSPPYSARGPPPLS